jgi:hypothetical protein
MPVARRSRRDSALHVVQEALERVDGSRGVGNRGEFGAAGAERRRDHGEGVRVRRLRHLGRIFLAEAVEPEIILGQRIADLGAQDVGALDLVERLPFLPALAVQQLDLLGGFAPALRRPIDIGAQPDGLAAVDIGDDFERQIVPLHIR